MVSPGRSLQLVEPLSQCRVLSPQVLVELVDLSVKLVAGDGAASAGATGPVADRFDEWNDGAAGSARLGGEHPPVLLQSFEDVDGDVVTDGVGQGELVENAACGGGDAADELDELGDRFDVADPAEGEGAGGRGDGCWAGVDVEAEGDSSLGDSVGPGSGVARRCRR